MIRGPETGRPRSPAALFGRHRERLPAEPGDYRGPTYYGQPALKPSPWTWEVATYMFLAGLGGSAQILATAADLLGGPGARSVVRHGRYLAVASSVLGAPLLISDLKTPGRWYNMLRIFRATSPTSIGSYILTTFGGASALAAAGQVLADRAGGRDHSTLARVAQIPATLAGAGMSTYTAALLSATSTPLWAAEPRLLAARFACSAMATGAAALSLAEQFDGGPRNSRTLDRVALTATAAELVISVASERTQRARGIGRPLRQGGWGAAHTLGAIGLGAGLPLACYGVNLVRRRRSRALSIAASLAVLAGGMIMRHAVLHAGQQSAKRPGEYFRLTRGAGR
jgi:protein NrfD